MFSILIHNARPSGSLICPKFILQHDNDPKHTARVIKNYLQQQEEQGVLPKSAEELWLQFLQDAGTTDLPSTLKNCMQVYRGELLLFEKQRILTPNIDFI